LRGLGSHFGAARVTGKAEDVRGLVVRVVVAAKALLRPALRFPDAGGLSCISPNRLGERPTALRPEDVDLAKRRVKNGRERFRGDASADSGAQRNRSPQDREILGAFWLRGLDLNQRPLGYEPIASLHVLQRGTTQHKRKREVINRAFESGPGCRRL